MQEVESPCVNVCTHDDNGICYGCRRTVAEVGDWNTFTNAEKLEVIERTKERRNTRSNDRSHSF